VTAPTLTAYPLGNGLPGLRAWCGHCRRWHHHGDGYGHRTAHCTRPGSPYSSTGYVLTTGADQAEHPASS
jgi:hypothetical protein